MTAEDAAAFTRHLVALEAAADWSAAAEAFEAASDDLRTPRGILVYVFAAVALGDAARVERATQVAIAAQLPRGDRVNAARRLAGGGHGTAALATLIADPDIFRDDGVLTPLGPTLRLVQGALADKALQAALQTAWKRFANLAEATPAPTEFAYAPAAPLPGGAPGFSLEIRFADPAMAAEARALRQLDRQFQATLANDRVPAVSAWHDVFVNDMGQIWTPDRRVIRTHRWPLLRQSRLAMETAPRIPEAIFAFNEASNFYHWYAEWLPSLAWYPPGRTPPIPLLQPAAPPPFIAESLAMALGEALPLISAGKAVHVGRLLVMPAGLPWLTRFDAYRPMLARIVAAAARAAPGGGPRLLYISRGGAGARPLANETEVEATLAAEGFEVVTFAGMPLARQIALVRGAACIVAPHGAALGHLLTARPGTRVLELMPVAPGWRDPRFCMVRLSRVIGHRHTLWLEPSHGAQERWRVDVPGMLGALRELLAD
ncbi:glycosyltransferase family 61 protein [Roseomonas rosulenta]|uniref:glycosyltransferase family 61 protein n=1 Tax=Roseomonas rosulenta TaxID=2748667 RepID=UPI0018DF6254|nr:glycosyltransferase family 61 protein [Roseomonas rosulenta]